MTRHTSKKILVGATAALLLFGCAPSEEITEQGQIIEPTFERGKNDRLGSVQEVAALGIGQEFAGEFTEDFQFFGHVFYAGREGASIDLEVTQRGSARGLDTTLFLYGEKEPGDWQRLMTDDNDGWGDLSKLANVEFRGNFERYMAVVGTADGLGRGQYNFAITCTSGDCTPDMPSMTSCPESTRLYIEECVSDSVNFGDGEVHESTVACTESDLSPSYYEWDCDVGAFGMPAPFCTHGYAFFDEALYPACITAIMGPLQGKLSLERGSAISPTLDEAIAKDACDICVDDGAMYLYGNGEATMQDVLFAVQGLEDFGHLNWEIFPGQSPEQRFSATLLAAILEELELADASELELTRMNAEWEPASGATEYVSADVVVHLDTQRVLVLRSVSGD